MTPTITISDLQKKPSFLSTQKNIFKIENGRKKKILSIVLPFSFDLSKEKEEKLSLEIKNLQNKYFPISDDKMNQVASLAGSLSQYIPDELKILNIDDAIDNAKNIVYKKKYS